MTAALGGPVRVAPYALYGSDELAAHMLDALRDRTGCLLRNHGTIAYGDHPRPGLRPHRPAGVDVPGLAHRRSVPGHSPPCSRRPSCDEAGGRLRGYGQQG